MSGMSLLPTAFDWLQPELAKLEAADLRRSLAVRESAQANRVTLNGRSLVNFGANDYLGLAADHRLATAATTAMQELGSGSGASPLVSGRGTAHAALEESLAKWKGTEAALLFPSGFATGSGVIPALVGEGDVIFADEKNHACLIDGCRLAKAMRVLYRHADANHLREQLQSHNAKRKLIVTDSLFSMDGDFAPLADIATLAVENNAMVLVDEAHATGVFGPNGEGLLAEISTKEVIPPAAFIRVGTLSKALASQGGFVCGPQLLIDWLANRARSYVFSTAPATATAAAAIESIKLVQHEPHRRRELRERAAKVRDELLAAGMDIGNSQSQIIPVRVGTPARAIELAARLREAGHYVPCIRPPTVPEGESLARISLSYAHTKDEIARLIESLQAALA